MSATLYAFCSAKDEYTYKIEAEKAMHMQLALGPPPWSPNPFSRLTVYTMVGALHKPCQSLKSTYSGNVLTNSILALSRSLHSFATTAYMNPGVFISSCCSTSPLLPTSYMTMFMNSRAALTRWLTLISVPASRFETKSIIARSSAIV